jgi:uncharacterized tellurite resistance protein B-like protein
MGFLNKVFGAKGEAEREILACAKILYLVALADGKIVEQELNTILEFLETLGFDPDKMHLSEKDFFNAGKEAGVTFKNGNVEEVIAMTKNDIRDYRKRLDLLLSCVKLTESDKDLSEPELQMFLKIAYGLGVKKEDMEKAFDNFSFESKKKMLNYSIV